MILKKYIGFVVAYELLLKTVLKTVLKSQVLLNMII